MMKFRKIKNRINKNCIMLEYTMRDQFRDASYAISYKPSVILFHYKHRRQKYLLLYMNILDHYRKD